MLQSLDVFFVAASKYCAYLIQTDRQAHTSKYTIMLVSSQINVALLFAIQIKMVQYTQCILVASGGYESDDIV